MERPKLWAMAEPLDNRFWCVTTTPRGVPVEPDVYWSRAIESEVRAGRRQSSAPSSIASSVTTQGSRANSGAWSNSSWVKACTRLSESTISARELRTTARSRGSVRATRMGSGGYTGTATMPA